MTTARADGPDYKALLLTPEPAAPPAGFEHPL